MKKLFNISYIALFAVLALFSACTESEDYTPAAQPPVENNGYRFNVDVNKEKVLNLSDTIFVIEVLRDSIANEETLELSVKADSIFDIPTSVTFAAGEAKAELVIGCSELKPFVKYAIEEIKLVDDNLINPYEQIIPIISLKVYKEDYVPYANGVYTLSALWGGGSFEQVLEYSPILETYRFKNLWSVGDVTFKITNQETMEFEMTEEVYNTGIDYQPGAPIVAYPIPEDNAFDAATNTFYFRWQFYVPALGGGFSPMYEAYTITEYYE